MVDGSRRYRAYCDRLRLSSTEFVMQPRRFFGPSRHFELEWVIQGGRIFAEHAKNTATMQRLKTQEQTAVGREEGRLLMGALRSRFEGKTL